MGFLKTSLFSFSWHYLFACSLPCIVRLITHFTEAFPACELQYLLEDLGPLSSPLLTSLLLSTPYPCPMSFASLVSVAEAKRGGKFQGKEFIPSPKTSTAELTSQVLLSSKPEACLTDGLIWNTSVLDGGFLFMCFSTVRDFSHLCGLQKGLGKDKPPTWDHLAPWQLASQPGGLCGWPAELGDLRSSQKLSCRKSFSFPHHCWSADVCFPPSRIAIATKPFQSWCHLCRDLPDFLTFLTRSQNLQPPGMLWDDVLMAKGRGAAGALCLAPPSLADPPAPRTASFSWWYSKTTIRFWRGFRLLPTILTEDWNEM